MGDHGTDVTETFAAAAGGVRLELSEWQIAVLRPLRARLLEAGLDAALPTSVYPDGPDDDAEFQRLMAGERKQARAADHVIVEVTLDRAADGVVLSVGEAESWLRVLGEARLVLAAQLGIDSQGWENDGGLEESPDLALLHYLGWLHGGLVDVLADLLPA